jgi:hypothetical protein
MTALADTQREDGVEWIDDTAHPLGGSFRGRSDFLAYTLKRFTDVLPQGTQLHIESVLVRGHCAIVTMWFLPAAPSQFSSGYRYWWICDR